MKEKKVTMKKTIKLMLGILALAIALPTGAYLYYNHVWRGGDVTYTQITSAGVEKPWKQEGGGLSVLYDYAGTQYDEEGQAQEVPLMASKQLRQGAYLKVTYNQKRKLITNWSEITKAQVPKKALEQLEK
ncbi:MAG TPA: hypothetical protein DCZ00_06810 [Lactococcus sp.]|nr:hypothetical protein [Lactococcus sp.]